MVVISFTFNP